jgi:hypothetical protein
VEPEVEEWYACLGFDFDFMLRLMSDWVYDSEADIA